MDKFNFVRDGESKLPPGFRFQPTDEEIVFQYLARKTFSYPLPASVIPEINVFSFHPWELPGNSDQDRYFFSHLRESSYRSVNRSSRTTCGGYWKITGSDKQIVCLKRMPIVGIKRTLVFYKGKHPRAVRTDWFMHLYCIALSGNVACNIQQKRSSQGSSVQIGKWVLCHVFTKKRGTKAEVDSNSRRRNYDFMITGETSDTDSSSASSSSYSCDSDSSAVSEVSSNTANSETNSGRNV
ncbi:NAC domain-containing protein 83 [Sesamum indicum]|uniref:NAC domain-containing protein 83 n=1 Tax=Sesamum indicum TaxID=4182 RepID=A0A6I9SSV0_SESIN|nr:NAC domain-containing protein 83 [Sesamum indicum]